MAHVYLLLCNDGTFYVGSTSNLDARLWMHQQGRGAEYTKDRLPVTLVWAQEFERVVDAFAVERKLHGWSHAKKQAVVDGNWHLLPSLARSSKRKREEET